MRNYHQGRKVWCFGTTDIVSQQLPDRNTGFRTTRTNNPRLKHRLQNNQDQQPRLQKSQCQQPPDRHSVPTTSKQKSRLRNYQDQQPRLRNNQDQQPPDRNSLQNNQNQQPSDRNVGFGTIRTNILLTETQALEQPGNMNAVFLLSLAVIYSSITTEVTGYLCYKCDNVAIPDLCDQITECGPHESCFVERFMSDRGSVYYKSGCKEVLKNESCAIVHGNRKRTSFPDCSECCASDFCNRNLCSTAPMRSLTRCLQCNGVFNPLDCTRVTTCSHDQSCYTQEVDKFGYRVYNLGCQPKTSCTPEPIFGRRQLKQTRAEKCHICCDGENCNRNLCETSKTTVTTSVTTTTTTTPTTTPTTTRATTHTTPTTPPPTTPTTTQPPYKRDCDELYKSNIRTSGVYRISPDNRHIINVYCDMDNGGGWIVFIRRTNAILNFTRGWNDYVTGFGDLQKDFWLGLDNIHLLTNPPVDVMIEGVTKSTSENVWTRYHNFTVDGPGTNYTMHVNRNGIYSTVALRLNYDNYGFGYHDGGQFYSDIDQNHVYRCAKQFGGSWWFRDCWEVLITNEYNHMNLKSSLAAGLVTSVKIKIRRT